MHFNEVFNLNSFLIIKSVHGWGRLLEMGSWFEFTHQASPNCDLPLPPSGPHPYRWIQFIDIKSGYLIGTPARFYIRSELGNITCNYKLRYGICLSNVRKGTNTQTVNIYLLYWWKEHFFFALGTWYLHHHTQ